MTAEERVLRKLYNYTAWMSKWKEGPWDYTSPSGKRMTWSQACVEQGKRRNKLVVVIIQIAREGYARVQ